jgi:chemotaxis protein CheC
MNDNVFTDDQKDALQEVFNVSIGQAANALARYFDLFVKLSVPELVLIKSDQLVGLLSGLIGRNSSVSIVRQSFFNHIQGESLAIFHSNDDDLVSLLGNESASVDDDILLDLSNILSGACLKGVAQQLGTEMSFSPPDILCKDTLIEEIFDGFDFAWDNALLVNIIFRFEDRTSSFYLLFFVPSQSIELIKKSIDRLLG